MRPIQHIVNVSGGKDSTATYLLALERLDGNFRAVFADTGNEHESTYEFVARLHERTGGPKVEVVRADFTEDIARHRLYVLENWPDELQAGRDGSWRWMPHRGKAKTVAPAEQPPPPKNVYRSATVRFAMGSWRWNIARRPMTEAEAMARVAEAAAAHVPTGNPYLDLCISKGFFPGRMRQFCTEELKQLPITMKVILPALRKGPVLQWLGIRAEESIVRSKQPRFGRDDTGAYLWRPILKWTVDDVWAQHKKHRLLPNPLYSQGMGRVGCMPCINCRKEEMREIAERFPGHVDRIAQWEEIVRRASKYGEATFFPSMKDSRDRDRSGSGLYANIRDVVEWSKTDRGGRQYGLFWQRQAGGGCANDMGLCEREAV